MPECAFDAGNSINRGSLRRRCRSVARQTVAFMSRPPRYRDLVSETAWSDPFRHADKRPR
jgi:hypothetical protein